MERDIATLASCIYEGSVVHKRLRPKPHAMSYRVFSFLLDVDDIDAMAARLWLFSRNRWNFISFHDRDHGVQGGGHSVAVHARSTFAAAGLSEAAHRVYLLAYPRVCGYGFNPISVYLGYGDDLQLRGVIYEVNNTFGERRSYVVRTEVSPVGSPGDVHAHGCKKELYVSPFTDMKGRYGFRLRAPSRDVLIAVNLRDDDGALLKTHFRGDRVALADRQLARLLLRLPLLTLKVILAIHWEAAKLWWKGVPLTSRSKVAAYSVTHVGSSHSGVDDLDDATTRRA
jgi:uncharacterized protein